jgi:hypothetical protein
MGAETLKVTLTNDFGVGEYTLSQSEQRRIVPPVERREERLELRLHFRLADERRSQAAHDLQEQRVGFFVCYYRRVRLAPIVGAVGFFREEGDFTQACAPEDSSGWYRRRAWRLVNQSEAHRPRSYADEGAEATSAAS